MSAIVAIFLVVWLFRIFTRHTGQRVAAPAVQVIVIQPAGAGAVQIPALPGPPPAAAVQSQYSRPFSPGFLGLNRQN